MINTEKWKEYAPCLVRIGVSLVFLWFGLNQVFDPSSFLGYLPDFATTLPLPPLVLIMINGIFEIILAVLLVLGLCTRIAALLLALHLVGIIISLGYNEIAVRDFGLMLATLSVCLSGNDNLCLVHTLRR
ncbi:DoxX family protein [Candidatus Woesearchaeota archaeon]|nr:DoxX family protein [Candidatus Woesearchaeota archaeon]